MLKKYCNTNYWSTRDLIVVALMAALGLAVKPLVKPLTHLISTPLGIPGGTLGGGLYMMWLSLAVALVPRYGTGTLTGLLQGLVCLITGWFGSHGAFSLITYALPGLVIDLLGQIYRRYKTLDGQIIYCLAANLTGTWIVGFLLMRLPKLPLSIAMDMSVLSGAIGGVLSWLIYRQLNKYRLL